MANPWLKNFIFATTFSSIVLLHSKHSFEKVIYEVWYQACDLMSFMQQTHIYILQPTYEYHPLHAAGYQMTMKKQQQSFFCSCEINAIKFATKNKISHKIMYHYMNSYGYIIMTIVDSCIIWYHLE